MRLLRLSWRVVKRSTAGLRGLALGAFAWGVYLVFRRSSAQTRCWWFQNIARVIYLIWSGGRHNVLANLALIRPNLTKKQTNQVTQSIIRTLVLNWAELLGDRRSDPELIRKRVSGIEELLVQYKSGVKIVVVFPHIGPIHSLMSAIAAFGLRVFVPAEAIPVLLYKLMARQRSKYADIQFAPVRKGQVLEKCAEKLAEGSIVILAMDILTEGGVPCRIGEEAVGRFPVGAVRLALKSEAVIIPIFPGWGEDSQGLVVVGEPFELTRSGDLTADTVNNVRRLIALYEPFLVENCSSWWRLPWSKLEPVGEGNNIENV